MTAIWSDGSKTQEVVTWPAVDVTNAGTTAKTVTVNGKIGKSSLPAKAIVTVQGISSVENASVATKSTVDPNLPTMVKVTWTDKSTSTEKVTWSALKPTDYTSNAKKVVTVSGTVAKTNLKSKLFLTIHALTSVSKPAISTKSGTAPVLPATVKATWTDGSVTEEAVVWPALIPEQYTSLIGEKVVMVEGSLKKTSLKAVATIQIMSEGIAVYRLYNPNNLEHFYTASLNERGTLVRIGWGVNEGIGWYAPASGAPVYRLYNKTLKDHHYTTSENERDVLVSKHGWKYEGIAWYGIK